MSEKIDKEKIAKVLDEAFINFQQVVNRHKFSLNEMGTIYNQIFLTSVHNLKEFLKENMGSDSNKESLTKTLNFMESVEKEYNNHLKSTYSKF